MHSQKTANQGTLEYVTNNVTDRLELLNNACDKLLANKKIRCACIVDNIGNLTFEKKQSEIDLLLPDEKLYFLATETASEIFMQHKFDAQIGSLQYDISHRKKIDIITIPILDYVILVSVKPNENCKAIANGAIMIFKEIFKK